MGPAEADAAVDNILSLHDVNRRDDRHLDRRNSGINIIKKFAEISPINDLPSNG